MKKLVLLSLLVATATAARAQTSGTTDVKYYVQPSFVYAFLGDFKDAAGGAVSFGAAINRDHLVDLEVARFNSETTKWPALTMDFTPILLNYRYRFSVDGGVSFQVGGCIGTTLEKPSNYAYGSLSSASAFTIGGIVGVSKSLTDTVSLDLSAKVLRLNSTSLTTSGGIQMLTLGVNFRL